MHVTCKATGEAALHKLACSEARIGKSMKVRTESDLDPLYRILVSGSGLGSAFGMGWHVYTLQSEEAL